MTTDFFNRKSWGIKCLSLLLATAFFAVVHYSVVLIRKEKILLEKYFCFAVSTSTHIEASTHTVSSQGGAGYLLSFKNKDYVAYAVYFSEEEGVKVETSLLEMGEEVFLLKKKVDVLYLTKRKDKEKATIYQNAFNALYAIMQALQVEITRLEEGATQSSSKEVIRFLSGYLQYLFKKYDSGYSTYAKLCKQSGEQLSVYLKNTIYAKDLRYEVCRLADGYLQLASAFSL